MLSLNWSRPTSKVEIDSNSQYCLNKAVESSSGVAGIFPGRGGGGHWVYCFFCEGAQAFLCPFKYLQLSIYFMCVGGGGVGICGGIVISPTPGIPPPWNQVPSCPSYDHKYTLFTCLSILKGLIQQEAILIPLPVQHDIKYFHVPLMVMRTYSCSAACTLMPMQCN